MALRGTLDSFPLSELLQFLAFTSKTGILRVYDSEETKLISFREGRVEHAVHQRPVPGLSELIVRSGLVSEDAVRQEWRTQRRWDELVGRSVARRRLLSADGSGESPAGNSVLCSYLLSQGRLTDAELEAALRPENLSDRLLEELVRKTRLVPAEELDDVWSGSVNGDSLLNCLTENDMTTRREIERALLHASDEFIAEALVEQGRLARGAARQALMRIEAIDGSRGPTVHLGEYLVTTGQVSRRQFEGALLEQLDHDKRLGEILVERRILTPRDVKRALEEIESLRMDFGPLYPVRQKLVDRFGISPQHFTTALSIHEKTGRTLSDILVASEKISESEMRNAAQEVVVEEICDLFTWTTASFEFSEELSLGEALGANKIPPIYSKPFEVPRLLLEAHSLLDEFRRSGAAATLPVTIFECAGGGSEEISSQLNRHSVRVLQRVDGRTPFRKIRRILPGNQFSHLRLFGQMVVMGFIRPIAREEAYLRGKHALTHGQAAEALGFFRHALRTEGEAPSDAHLRSAIRDARLARERNPFKRCRRALRKLSRVLATTPPARAATRLARLLGGAATRARENWDEVLVRSRLARALWRVRSRTLGLLDSALPRRIVLPRWAIGMALLVALGLVHLRLGREIGADTAAVASAETAETIEAEIREAPLDVRAPLARYVAPAPTETAPILGAERVFFVARDGKLRALRLDSTTPSRDGRPRLEPDWELVLGEVGDILRGPSVAGQLLFVVNVRGRVYAVSREGHVIWKESLPRVEPLAPVPLYGAGQGPKAVVVASRETVRILSPETGALLSQLVTGNRIQVAPVGRDDHLFVASGDKHLYKFQWRRGSIDWDREEADEVTALLWIDDTLVFTTRGGHVAGLDVASGNELWRQTLSEGNIQGVWQTGPGSLYVAFDGGSLARLSSRSGEVTAVTRTDPEPKPVSLFPLDGQWFYVSLSGHVGALDRSGRARWESPNSLGRVAGLDIAGDMLAVTSLDGNLTLLPLDLRVSSQPTRNGRTLKPESNQDATQPAQPSER